MNSVRIEENNEYVRVSSDYWTIEHLKRAGGAWHALKFTHGSGQNSLRGPAGSAIRVLQDDAGAVRGAGVSPARSAGFYAECNELTPRVQVEFSADGTVAVIAEGTYRNADGETIPVGYWRRREYGTHGIIWTSLQIMSECGCGRVGEVRGLDLPLRAGLTDAYVRVHPTQAGGADLLGGRTWIDLNGNSAATPFLSRFTPLQMACFERGVEGLEIFPGSELAQWDCAFKPDIGLGLYRLAHDASGAVVELAPYCMVARRMKIRLQGTITLRLGLVLSEPKARSVPKRAVQHAFISDPQTSDAQIEQHAAEGVSLIVFKDDYRDGGVFWRNGAVNPYAPDGMAALRRLIEACQRCQIKIVPYIAAHELHPETHAYELHARAWMHAAAPSLDVVHTHCGAGEVGGLMCLRSGWLDYRKKTIDAILRELPWDGVCLDWPALMPCCHSGHASGPFHSDVEELHDLVLYCRKRVGAEGTLAFIGASDSSILAANLADHILPRA